jgi:hypothetical protein
VVAKKPYRSPKLTSYGRVVGVTAGSSGGAGDGKGSKRTGGGGGKGKKSERSLKKDIVQVASHPSGISLYLFDYKPSYRDLWEHDRQLGVMANEVEAVFPEAVSLHPEGYRVVDYDALWFISWVDSFKAAQNDDEVGGID